MGYPQEYLSHVSEEQLWNDYLETCLKGIRPYGCRKYFGEKGGTKYIGTLKEGKQLRDIYEDDAENYWFGSRVMIGRWVITTFELTRGRKDLDNPYEKHTGTPSDWDKVQERYGGIPPGWEKIQPEDQEERNENGNNRNNADNADTSERVEGYKRAV